MHVYSTRRTQFLFLIALLLVFVSADIAMAREPGVSVAVSQSSVVVSASYAQPEVVSVGDGLVEPRIAEMPVYADAAGLPRLPQQQLTIVVPPGMEVADIKVSGRRTLVPGSHRLAWGHPPQPISSGAEVLADPDPAVYEASSAYPQAPAEMVKEGFFRGYRLATMRVRPVQWVGRTGELYAWRDVRVELALSPAATSADASVRGLAEDLVALSRIAENPETGFDYPAPMRDRADEPYLIICPEALRSAFSRLLDHRNASGMPGRIMTVEDIVASYPGADDAEKMREAIRDAYNERGTTYVLLGGDDQDGSGNRLVPYRGCLLNAGGYRYEDAPSDYYFGALDGTWNADGDNVWCEPDEIDYYSEVHIGRATVDTVTEADRFIDKVLAYEAGLAEDRRRDLVFMGESLDSSTWGGDSMDVTIGLIPEDEYDITRLYEKLGTFSRSAVIDNLNRGPHLTNHLGHANTGYVMGIYSSDVDGLTNESPFFSYSQGCDSGAWDQKFSGSSEAISEHFLTAEHAAFGVVMNVRYGWYSSASVWGPSQFLAHEFFDALFTEGFGRLGEANDDSRHDNASAAQSDAYRRWCFLETNLHGDPATPVQVGNRLEVVGQRAIEDDPVHGNVNGETDPGETIHIAVTLENLRDQDLSNVHGFIQPLTEGVTVRNHFAEWGSIAGGEQKESLAPHFSATVGVGCGEYATFSLEMRYGDGDVEHGTFTLLVGERTHEVLFEDDFESNQSWSVSGDCTDGDWVRDEPVGTMDGNAPSNPGEDATPDPGSRCYVTGNDGVSADDDDVDDGYAVLTSPTLDATGYLDLELGYARWYHVAPKTVPPSNSLKIEVSDDGGSSWQVLEDLPNDVTPWASKRFALESLLTLGPGIAMRVTAGERAGAARDVVVEAGLDDVIFEGTKAYCEAYESGASTPPAPVGNTLSVHRVGDHVRLEWQSCGAGGGHDAAEFYTVSRALSPGASADDVAEVCDPHFVDRDAAISLDYHEYVVTASNEAGCETP